MKNNGKKKSRGLKKKFKLSKKLCEEIKEAAIQKQMKNDLNINKISLIHLYWHVGLSQKQIGDIFGVTHQCISHKMHNMGISIRKKQQSQPKRQPKRHHKHKARKVKIQSPNTYEQKIIDVCTKMNYPFTFVGNKYKVIDNKSPDFIDTNGSKCIIECYSKYWHKNDYEQTRGDFFRERDYKILFLSDEDLNVENWEEICIMEINKFLKVDD